MLVYNSAFNLQTMTAAINKLTFAPGRIAQLGIFEENGITSANASIELRDGKVTLIDAKPRGAPGTPTTGSGRKVYPFMVPHLPETATIMADEVLGVRAFGTENQAETVNARRDERLANMRRNIDYTIEAHRLAAIKGNFYDANGSTTSLFTTFGLTQKTVNMALTTATTKVRQKILELLEKIEASLDGMPYTGVRVLCGSSFWSELIEHSAVKEVYLNTARAAELAGSPLMAFEFGGVIWERYRGTSTVKVEDDDAYAVPTGVPELFLTRFAPANYNETVNTVGLPYYSKGEMMRMGKGWDLEAQSNPLNICTVPDAVIKLTKA